MSARQAIDVLRLTEALAARGLSLCRDGEGRIDGQMVRLVQPWVRESFPWWSPDTQDVFWTAGHERHEEPLYRALSIEDVF